MLPISNWELVLALATFPHWQHLQVLELESGIGDLRILYGTLLFVSRFSTLSSQSNPKTQHRALGELGVRYIREFYALGQRPKISLEIYSC